MSFEELQAELEAQGVYLTKTSGGTSLVLSYLEDLNDVGCSKYWTDSLITVPTRATRDINNKRFKFKRKFLEVFAMSLADFCIVISIDPQLIKIRMPSGHIYNIMVTNYYGEISVMRAPTADEKFYISLNEELGKCMSDVRDRKHEYEHHVELFMEKFIQTILFTFPAALLGLYITSGIIMTVIIMAVFGLTYAWLEWSMKNTRTYKNFLKRLQK